MFSVLPSCKMPACSQLAAAVLVVDVAVVVVDRYTIFRLETAGSTGRFCLLTLVHFGILCERRRSERERCRACRFLCDRSMLSRRAMIGGVCGQ